MSKNNQNKGFFYCTFHYIHVMCQICKYIYKKLRSIIRCSLMFFVCLCIKNDITQNDLLSSCTYPLTGGRRGILTSFLLYNRYFSSYTKTFIINFPFFRACTGKPYNRPGVIAKKLHQLLRLHSCGKIQ